MSIYTKSYLVDADDIIYEIQQRNLEGQLEKRRVYNHAVTIQRWARGHLTRIHLLKLHNASTIIQAYWKTYWHVVNMAYQTHLEYRTLCQKHYDMMATKIQALWRGHVVRKTHDFNNRKKFIEQVKSANESLKQELQKRNEEWYKLKMEEIEKEKWTRTLILLDKLHHLIRTRVAEGIYSLDSTWNLSPFEELLKKISERKSKRALKMIEGELRGELRQRVPHSYLNFIDKQIPHCLK